MVCEVITISTCPSGTTCDSCKEIVKSHCIKYVGEDLVYLNIEDGDTLKEILIKLDVIVQNLSGV